MIAGDIRFALRQVARAPLFSGVVIAVLALGIGINAGLLTLLDTYAWRPAPGIPSDARLVRIIPRASSEGGHQRTVPLSYPDVIDLRAEQGVFTEVAAWRVAALAVDFGGGAEPVAAHFTTANYFRALRVTMAAGAGFPAADDLDDAPVVVIGHSLWVTHFGGSPDAIGKTIHVMGHPFTVAGVAPPRFPGVNVTSMGTPTIWITLGAATLVDPRLRAALARRDATRMQAVARLGAGVEPDEVTGATSQLAARVAREEPEGHRGFAIGAERLTGMRGDASDTKETIIAFFLVAALIVLITCTNVSALLIGRAVARRREIGVRLSLGATRLRILGQMLTESLVLALAGALLALVLYTVSIRAAYAAIPEIVWGLEPKAATFLAAAGFAIATTIAAGLAPALHAARTGVGEAIRNGGSHGIRRARLQSAFVIAQLACSMPVLIVTSLVLVNLRADATSVADEPPASVLAMDSDLRPPLSVTEIGPAMRDSATRVNFPTFALARRRLEQITGVRSVAISTSAGSAAFRSESGAEADVHQVHVTASWFTTLGARIVQGRAFGVEDDRAGFSGVVVNEEAARRLWPGENPIGRRLTRREEDEVVSGMLLNSARGSPASLEVIGVSRSPSYEGNRGTPMLFVPLANAASLWNASIAIRTSGGDARALVPAIRATLREVDPLLTVTDVVTLAERHAGRAREEQLSNLGAFVVGMAALLLASLGLYAIVAFGVAQRTREIGIRLAVGARASDVVRQFLGDGIRVTAIALAIGIPVTVAAIRVVQSQQASFTTRNAGAVLLVVPVLVGVAALASWLPARRAGRVDPLVALRSD